MIMKYINTTSFGRLITSVAFFFGGLLSVPLKAAVTEQGDKSLAGLQSSQTEMKEWPKCDPFPIKLNLQSIQLLKSYAGAIKSKDMDKVFRSYFQQSGDYPVATLNVVLPVSLGDSQYIRVKVKTFGGGTTLQVIKHEDEVSGGLVIVNEKLQEIILEVEVEERVSVVMRSETNVNDSVDSSKIMDAIQNFQRIGMHNQLVSIVEELDTKRSVVDAAYQIHVSSE